jgi:hypothetical protein
VISADYGHNESRKIMSQHISTCIAISVIITKANTLVSVQQTITVLCEISSSHGSEYDVQSCLLGYTGMMEAVRTSETSVDNHFTQQYNPEDNSENHSTVII